jgi:hypothetical protein|tara:strand:- start:1218 stop:2093 length:876 start_codon:yes stop_codon:yes gene_type:complete
MADGQGQADIRGLDIDKLAKGFADEEYIFKRFVTNSTTSAREIRWYQKTSGAVDTVDTSGITSSQIVNQSFKSLPWTAEQTWTRNTSYIRKYFVESPLISMEDIKDSDVDILATHVRDLVRAVAAKVDARIYTAITTDGNILTGAATQDGWDDLATGNPILDIMVMKQQIRAQGYNVEGAILAINSIENKWLLNYLISVKGSSIPQFASEKVQSGVVMNILGVKVVVSENATTDQAAMWIPNRSATWKSFAPISSVVIDEPMIGKKVRVMEEGECIVTDPKSIYLLTDTIS